MSLRPALGRAALYAAVAAICALPPIAFGRELPNFDALSSVPESAAAPRSAALSALTATSPQIQVEPRLGVPRFLWGRDVNASTAQAKQASLDDEGRARAHLRNLAALYRISASEIDALVLGNRQRFPDGGAVVRFRNEVEGMEVFREQVNVLVDRRGDLVAVGGFATGAPVAARKAETTPAVSRERAAATALADWGFDASVAQGLAPTREEGGYAYLASQATTADGTSLAAPIRAKRVWYRMPGELVPAWYVEVQVRDAGSRDVDGYSYVVSAVDGALLFRNNLSADVAFGYRVYAEPTPPFLPLPGPGGRGGFPHPTATPDGYQPPLVTPNLVTLESAPFSKNDPWLPGTANRTIGNNVEAFSNPSTPDGYGPAGSDECNLAAPVDGDLHACTTSANTFDHTFNTDLPPNANRTQVSAAVTNLFYTINWLHDWFYDAGFDEAAGNAQSNNYSRGGLGNDSIFAEAQDFTGTNNANMFTPADGQRPRMRQFFWTGGVSLVKVNAPPPIAGVKPSNTAEFGPQGFDLTADTVVALDAINADGPLDTDGCSPFTNAAAVAGKIAIIDRGVCTFVVKVKNAQNAGAVGVVIVNNISPGAPGMAGTDATITIPALSVSLADGNAIKAQLGQSATVSLRMARQAGLPREGAIDNTVVAHEWGHYLSNRLVNNSNGLVANQARGMGEGWSDFVALLLTVKEGDRNIASNANFNGTYPNTPYPFGGPDFAPDVLNNAYYYGIRRYPYTRDMSKNPLTFKHISDGVPLPATPTVSPRGSGSANSEVHNTGEVWASMLWECYSNLLNDTARLTFAQAQDRMKRYLVAAFKITPTDPTFVNARDALLAVMLAQDAQDHDLCFAGFAKRGLGAGAVAPNKLSEDNAGAIESFSTGINPGVKNVAVEYYHAAFDHYFVTHIADEITKLDNGTFVGWTRTGESFNVFADAPPGAAAVCRFFSTSFAPKSSHFYTPDVAECNTVKQNPNWQFEAEVFTIWRPDAAGNCPADTRPVYRMYNNGQGAAPNHRYTTSLAARATMLSPSKGWIPEGYGPLGVIMCSPI
jgi:hypothetical protein